LARHAPRGKGWLPRQIGRRLGGRMKLLIPTRSGAKLAVDSRNLDVYTSILNAGGVWDAHVIDACCRLLRKGAVFYDIGANAGCVSLEVAMRLEDQVRIYAFEPQPRLSHNIALSAALNGLKNLHVFGTMLGREPGAADLFIPGHCIHASAVPRAPRARRLHCPVTTIDALVGAAAICPPDVIKIDVEGGEMDVFRGAAETIRRHRPHIIFECDVNASRFGYTRHELCQYLADLGDYGFQRVTTSGFAPIDSAGDGDDTFLAAPQTSSALHP
jgi:FkbM family methyltransferase